MSWQDLGLVLRAHAYAASAHSEQLRKGTGIPYLSHLWSVAALALEHGADDEQVAAALLHDVVEDCGGQGRLDDLRRVFGDAIADMVESLSDSLADTEAGAEKAPWLERKQHYLDHLATLDERVLLVSACDKLHNARCVLADYRAVGDRLWERFSETDPERQLWYYGRLVTAFAGRIPASLDEELARTVKGLSDEIDSSGPVAE